MLISGDLAAAIRNLPKFEVNRVWFPQVQLPRGMSHAQGIAAHTSSGGQVTVFVSISNFPRGWGALLINDNGGGPGVKESRNFGAVALPSAAHPGALAIFEDTLVIPFEHGGDDRAGWLAYYDLSPDPFAPKELTRVDLDAPSLADGSGAITHGDHRKASAVGVTRIGTALWVAVLSENRYLRFLASSPGDQPELIASCDASSAHHWPHEESDWPEEGDTVDAISLISDPVGGLWLVTFANTGFFDVLGRGTDEMELFRVHIDIEGPPDQIIGLSHRASTKVKLSSIGETSDSFRPSFRWGASVMTAPDGSLAVLAVEPFGSEEEPERYVEYLEFASTVGSMYWT